MQGKFSESSCMNAGSNPVPGSRWPTYSTFLPSYSGWLINKYLRKVNFGNPNVTLMIFWPCPGVKAPAFHRLKGLSDGGERRGHTQLKHIPLALPLPLM